MPPLVRFPANPVTPHGAYHILHDRIPMMGLTSYDETVVFHMMGGLAIADKVNTPSRVEIKDLKGLIAPWRTIDQKGATQDGVTFVDALYDPIEVELSTRVKGANPADCRRVARYLIDSLDAKQVSRLWWFTHHMGYWWAPVRWFRAPVDPVGGIKNSTQDLSLVLRADNGFWQSYPSVDEMVFAYETALDEFAVDDSDDLGTGWTVALSGAGTGGVHVENGQLQPTLLNGKTAVARKNGYTSGTNNQVVEIEIGSFSEWAYPVDGYDDAWARMNNTGTPGTSGVRLRVKRQRLVVSYFVGGVETVMREKRILIWPRPKEKFRLIAGTEGDERTFSVMRGGATIWTFKESGTGSPLGASNRSAGVGAAADGDESPPGIRRWAVGDNSTVTQSKFLTRYNVGDQPMWDRYTVVGPGTFRFWNGPGAGPNEYVEFGPLEKGQVAQLRTDPRKRGVVDMTITPSTPQQQDKYETSLFDFLSFAVANNVAILGDIISSLVSLVGIGGTGAVRPPQGNLYSLLKGRWSKPIPAKSPGKVAQPYQVKVSIDNGNADSKILVAGTPLRRMPY